MISVPAAFAAVVVCNRLMVVIFSDGVPDLGLDRKGRLYGEPGNEPDFINDFNIHGIRHGSMSAFTSFLTGIMEYFFAISGFIRFTTDSGISGLNRSR